MALITLGNWELISFSPWVCTQNTGWELFKYSQERVREQTSNYGVLNKWNVLKTSIGTIQRLTRAWAFITWSCFFAWSWTLCSTIRRRGIGTGACVFLLSSSTSHTAYPRFSPATPSAIDASWKKRFLVNWQKCFFGLIFHDINCANCGLAKHWSQLFGSSKKRC